MTACRVKADQRPGVMASIHATAVDLRQAGVMDRRTLRVFDEACRVAEFPGSADAGEAKAVPHRSQKKAP